MAWGSCVQCGKHDELHKMTFEDKRDNEVYTTGSMCIDCRILVRKKLSESEFSGEPVTVFDRLDDDDLAWMTAATFIGRAFHQF